MPPHDPITTTLPDRLRRIADLLPDARRADLIAAADENERLARELVVAHTEIDRLNPVTTLVMCDGCGLGVENRDTRHGLCLDCLGKRMGEMEAGATPTEITR